MFLSKLWRTTAPDPTDDDQTTDVDNPKNDGVAGGGARSERLSEVLKGTKDSVELITTKRENVHISFLDTSDRPVLPGTTDSIFNRIKDFLLIILIVLSVLFGLVAGLLLRNVIEPDDSLTIFYLEFPGRVFMSMLKSLVIPLVLTSIVAALATLGRTVSGRVGLRCVVYYLSTTFLAVILGIILVLLIRPGETSIDGHEDEEAPEKKIEPGVSLVDLISSAFPDNFVTAAFERTVTELIQNEMNASDGETIDMTEVKQVQKRGINVLGYITISIVLGVVMSANREEARPLIEFFSAANVVVLRITHLVIWLTPIGLFFLVAAKFVKTENLAEVGKNLGLYMFTVLLGLCLHGIIVLPAIYWFITKKSPLLFAGNMTKAIMTAWGTASSVATLPVTMECLVKNCHLDVNIVRFVVPIGATINMDGTALYEAVACIFIAQVNDAPMGIDKVLIISLTATAAAIGAAGIPQAGLVTMIIVLTSVGLPTEDVVLILAVDWFLDRFRTVMNIWGDSIGAGILDHLYGETIETIELSTHSGGSDMPELIEKPESDQTHT